MLENPATVAFRPGYTLLLRRLPYFRCEDYSTQRHARIPQITDDPNLMTDTGLPAAQRRE